MEVPMASYEKQQVIDVSNCTDEEQGDQGLFKSPNSGNEEEVLEDNEKNKKGRRELDTSGVRLFLRHLKKQRRNIHPIEERLSPQLVVRNGRFEVFDPEEVLQKKNKTIPRHINIINQSSRDKRFCSCLAAIKQRMDLLRFKYGDLVPLFRKQIKRIEGGYGSGVAAVFKFTRWAILLNLVLSLLWVTLLVIPAAVRFDYELLDNFQFSFENIFDGKGKLQHTWMFYGSYPSKLSSYRIDYAYIVTGLLTFFGSLLIILKSAVGTKNTADSNPFTMLVLASWDFSITGKEAQVSVAGGITTQAQDMLLESQAIFNMKSRTRRETCCIFARRAIAWMLSGALTAGACVTIYYFLVKVTVADFIISNTNVQIGKNFLEVYGFSLLFALLNTILPFIIQILPHFEAYEKGLYVVYVNIIRIFSLRFLNLFALIFTLYGTITSNSFRGCGGTFVGQEFYKIILLDIAVVTIVQFFTKFGMYIIRRKKKEPEVSRIVLQIVYRQALVWAGTFFCPVIPVLGVVAQSLVFALNYLIILITCKAPSKRFKQTEGIQFFKRCLIFTLLCLLVPITTVFASKYVSIGTMTTNYSNGTVIKIPCGPFGDRPPMDVFKEGKNDLPGWLSTLANWITSAAIFPVILVMSIIIYIQHLRYRNEKKNLRQLQIEYLEYQKRNNINLLRRKDAA